MLPPGKPFQDDGIGRLDKRIGFQQGIDLLRQWPACETERNLHGIRAVYVQNRGRIHVDVQRAAPGGEGQVEQHQAEHDANPCTGQAPESRGQNRNDEQDGQAQQHQPNGTEGRRDHLWLFP